MPVKKDCMKETQKRKGNVENLIPLDRRTKDEQREIARRGGIKSGEVRKEKKLVSQILADYLQKEHEVIIRDDQGEIIDREKLSASELIERTVTAVMARGDSASVQMIKTMGELSEGKGIKLSGSLAVKNYDLSKLSDEELDKLGEIVDKVDEIAEPDGD